MNYIDLLDDSDDDIPLIPSRNFNNLPKRRANQIVPPLHAVSNNQAVDVVSSDDDIPILKQSKLLERTAKPDACNSRPSDLNYDSDCTEKYSCSSDESSLPDIGLHDKPPESDSHRNVSHSGLVKSAIKDAYRHKISDEIDQYSDESSLPDIGIDHDPPHSNDYGNDMLVLPSVGTNMRSLPIQHQSSASWNIRTLETKVGHTSDVIKKDYQRLSKIDQQEEEKNSDETFTNIKIPVNKKTTKIGDKRAEREKVRQEKLLVQAQKREEKERKALEKKRDIAMKNAEREARRAAQPGECHRHMLLETDKKLEKTALGVCVEAVCVANCVPIKYVETPMSNAVIFKRKLVSPETGSAVYVQDENMAVAIEMCDMVDMILSTLTRASTHLSLDGYIEKVNRVCQSKPTLIVIGCEKYFRTLKTQNNRVYRDNVLGTQDNSKRNKAIPVITRLQYEETLQSIWAATMRVSYLRDRNTLSLSQERATVDFSDINAITALQMTSDTVIINHELEEDVAKTILRLNKSIAEAPIKRGRYEQQAMSVKTTGLKIGRANEGCRKVWQRMLQEFRNISADVSNAVISEWPSPYLLLKEYERLQRSSTTQAELLLQDIQIRRGGGVVQTKRRVGKETSRRVYELFTQHADFVIK